MTNLEAENARLVDALEYVLILCENAPDQIEHYVRAALRIRDALKVDTEGGTE